MSTAAQESRPGSAAAASQPGVPTGPAAAAILATGIGCGVLGFLALLAHGYHAAAAALTWFHPTGPLSGVTSLAILLWLAAWVVLARLWRGTEVPLGRATAAALAFLALGFLLTFPPITNWLLGK